MRLEQLEYLSAVVRHGSLRRASEHLHVSQPALSESLTKLERELGVPLLERRRSGARISRQGRDLMHHMSDVLDAANRLKTAARDQVGAARAVRVGTVNAGTSTVVVPGIQDFRESWPEAPVEVLDVRQDEVAQGVAEGVFDLGLVNLLGHDDLPGDAEATTLRHGRPVVVLPPSHPLAARTSVPIESLREERLVAMRVGYVMHRYARRLFGEQPPATSATTDGAAMGKTLVAEGLGLTLLPDYSVVDDPLERAGLITFRPVAGDRTTVSLVLLHRPLDRLPLAARALREAFIRAARES